MEFAKFLNTLQLAATDLLLSFDVVSLFTHFPLMDTLQLLKHLFSTGMMQLFEFALKSYVIYLEATSMKNRMG